MKVYRKAPMGLREVFDDAPGAIDNYPERFQLPMVAYVRKTFTDHRVSLESGEMPEGGVQAVWPGIGTITFQGGDRNRNYVFDFEPNYAKAKGYDLQVKGSW